jgi:cytochrome c-type biogenesis protein CcmF
VILTEIGYGALLLVMAAGLWAAVSAVLGARRGRPDLVLSARNALLAMAALSTLAAIVLLILLFRHSFAVSYVYEHVSTYLKPPYVLSAFWAGLAGSQLLWLWLLSIFTAALVLRRPTWDREMRPYAMAVLAVTEAFFALLLVVLSNPFELMPTLPAEGVSLNPLLQNFWMIVHPPIVFAAYALWTIPFAYAFAALVTGRLDSTWLFGIRRWALAAWATLGLGILVGGWWAYLELGWGGYWSWDPVENSSFIPWLVGTAFVHSAIIQSRRDMFRAWNVLLATLTFLLTVFATFVTRSGLIQSVHAFAESPIGYYYLAFMGIMLAITIGLMLARRRELKGSGQLGDLLSREFVFLVTNLLFLGSAAAVLLGTLWPTFTQAVRDVAVSLDPENYNRFMGPLGLLLVFLVGVCPLIEWRQVSVQKLLRSLWLQAVAGVVTVVVLLVLGVRELWAVLSFGIIAFAATTVILQLAKGIQARMKAAGENVLVATGRAVANNRRRYGGQIIHLSILLIVAGITGSQAYQSEVQVPLAPGETIDVGGYTLAYKSFTYQQIMDDGNKARYAAQIDVLRGDRLIASMEPERNLYSNVDGTVSEVALRSTPKEDLYIVLASLEEDGLAAFQVIITPMVMWLWIGGLVLLLGTLVAAWPTAKRPAVATVPARANVQAGEG